MLSFSSAVRIFLAVEPLDMCKYFDGLYAVAANELKENPQQGGMFVFVSALLECRHFIPRYQQVPQPIENPLL